MIITSRKATSLIEIMIAISIGITMLLPIGYFFTHTGQQVSYSQNKTLAGALARRICQYVYHMPYDHVKQVPQKPIGGDPNDPYFGQILNTKKDKSGIQHLTENELKDFYGLLSKHNFKYQIEIAEADLSYSGDYDDRIKSVMVYISWRENGNDWTYSECVYILPNE